MNEEAWRISVEARLAALELVAAGLGAMGGADLRRALADTLTDGINTLGTDIDTPQASAFREAVLFLVESLRLPDKTNYLEALKAHAGRSVPPTS